MLGICVVYLVPNPEAQVILRLHLRHLAANTTGPYRIYGVALRAPEGLVPVLLESGVALPEVAPYEARKYKGNLNAAGEHSHYLDQLVDIAFEDGCSCVTTFDMDSWPITKGWDSHYRKFLSPAMPVIAMRRAETGDEFPNPSFTMIDRGFWRAGQTSFALFNPRCRYKDGGLPIRLHSGAGILAELKEGGRTFLPLIRTNQWNPHPVMCGIYDHRVFHFGAGSRDPVFGGDKKEYDLIDTDLSRSFAKGINEAKRRFFLECLKKTGTGFIRQLMLGELANQPGKESPARPSGRPPQH